MLFIVMIHGRAILAGEQKYHLVQSVKGLEEHNPEVNAIAMYLSILIAHDLTSL